MSASATAKVWIVPAPSCVLLASGCITGGVWSGQRMAGTV